jgi:phosphoglycerol transferase MdoB-like AlkP superfamily enzyme|tara:strand:+ start:871 stop:2751 length:1881 start_codon:yes stop_codon:yes gene_type:complete
MKVVKKNIRQLLLRLGIAFLMFSASRLLFLVFNKSYFPDINIKVFFYGLRFDLVAICYLFAPFILLHVIPLIKYEYAWREKALRVLFHIGSLIGLFLNFIDVIYYNFIFKRSTFDIFDAIGEDGGRLLPTFIKDFWYMIPIYIGIVLGIDFLYKKTIKLPYLETIKKQLVIKFVLFIVVVLLTITGARGGTQLRPLSIYDGGKYTEAQNIPVLFNTTFTLLLSIQINTESELLYYDPKVVKELYTPIQKIEGKGKFKGKNIVFIILESFASEYIGYYNSGKGYTPFLDSLFNESYVFVNNRSNGLRSIEALPAMFAGIPNLNNTPYILSLNSTNKLYAFPHRLKELGYNTSFYHGGENGTMGFDAFCGLAGVDSYFGINEYPHKKSDYDGNWGIYDEPYLKYYAEELKTKKAPFFSSVFTLSSHHPYSIPEKYENKFKEGGKEVLETIGYTDFSLKQFFKSIQNEIWYENTLFVITADHPAQPINEYYIKANGKFKVPLAFFDPNGKLKGRTVKNAKHSDIPSTLLGLLGDTVKVVNFGEDLFIDQESFCVNYVSNNYNFREDSLVVQFNGVNVIGAFAESDSLLLINLKDSADYQSRILFIENKGKAYLQQYYTRVINNQLIPKH